jgi:hypothetical protein
MSDKSIAQRMFIKPGFTMAVLNAPPGYIETIGEIPVDVKILTTLVCGADIIQFFTKSRSDLEKNFKPLIQAIKDSGSLWISYPKGTSKVETDINRDIIWKIGEGLGLKPVAMISIDPIWAAFRLKKVL